MASLSIMHPSLMLTVILWAASLQAPPCRYSSGLCGCMSFSDISWASNDLTGSTVGVQATSEDTEYYYIDDMAFKKSRLLSDQGQASSQDGGAATGLNTMYWPGGIIFYVIDNKFSKRYRKRILNALSTIEQAVGKKHLEFKDAQTKTGKICRKFYLKIQLAKAARECKSEVGMQQDDVTKMWLNQDHCPSGTIIHEVLHALGRQHEHVRPDRDKYVTIKPDEIHSASCNNYGMQNDKSPSADPTLLEAYDFDSIMHYGSCFFSCRGEFTLLSNAGGEVKPNRKQMTSLDVQKVRRMFPANAKVPYTDAMCKRGRTLKRSSGGAFLFILSVPGLALVGFLV